MKRLLLGLGLLGVLLAVSTVVADDNKKGDGWVQLFNGKDLTGWKTHPDSPGNWSVQDGAIVGVGKTKEPSHLYSERGDYENFHYRIEAKINDKGNSGQYFRAAFMKGYPKIGYEAQINSTHSDERKTGSLYRLADVKEILVPPDTWFTQEVIADGNHIIIKVNGKQTVDFTDTRPDAPKKGHFAIQQHPPAKGAEASIVHVRKIEVKELPPSKN